MIFVRYYAVRFGIILAVLMIILMFCPSMGMMGTVLRMGTDCASAVLVFVVGIWWNHERKEVQSREKKPRSQSGNIADMGNQLNQQKNTVKRTTEPMRQIRLELNNIMAQWDGSENITMKLQHLAEDMRYSDPVSTPALSSLESDMKRELSQLEKMVKEHSEDITTQIDRLERLVKQRNQVCKETK